MSVQITLFGDFTSLACYATEAALRRLAEDRDLAVRFRAFERYPAPGHLPPPDGEDSRERLGPLLEALGLQVRAPGMLPRTRKAHEAARFAAEQGVEAALRLAMYHSFWTDGRDIGRIDVLQELAAGAGLDPVDLKIALDIDRYRDEVVRDREVGQKLGITELPVVFIGTGPGARILIGAQALADLDAAIGHG